MLWVPDLGKENSMQWSLQRKLQTKPGIITKPDAKVLDLEGLLLTDLLNRDNLASCLLELPELPEEVPETGLGHDLVGGKDPHPETT